MGYHFMEPPSLGLLLPIVSLAQKAEFFFEAIPIPLLDSTSNTRNLNRWNPNFRNRFPQPAEAMNPSPRPPSSGRREKGANPSKEYRQTKTIPRSVVVHEIANPVNSDPSGLEHLCRRHMPVSFPSLLNLTRNEADARAVLFRSAHNLATDHPRSRDSHRSRRPWSEPGG
jgi:hypothetical protein